MKQAILLHGTGGSATDYFWSTDTKKHLESSGYKVWWPQLPNTHKPELQETLSFVLDNMPQLDQESVLPFHSCSFTPDSMSPSLIRSKLPCKVFQFWPRRFTIVGYTTKRTSYHDISSYCRRRMTMSL